MTLDEIVALARQAPELFGRVHVRDRRREPLMLKGRPVGFVTPHERDGVWRHGPIFVLPAYRGMGVLSAYYASHPERVIHAFVRDDNQASRRAHERAKFVNHRRHAHRWMMRRGRLEER